MLGLTIGGPFWMGLTVKGGETCVQFDLPLELLRALHLLLPCPCLAPTASKRSKLLQPAGITVGISTPQFPRSLWPARNMSSNGRAAGCDVLPISAGVPTQAGRRLRNIPRRRTESRACHQSHHPPAKLSQRSIPSQRLSFTSSGSKSDVLLRSLNF
jgi:hypothetical protein